MKAPPQILPLLFFCNTCAPRQGPLFWMSFESQPSLQRRSAWERQLGSGSHGLHAKDSSTSARKAQPWKSPSRVCCGAQAVLGKQTSTLQGLHDRNTNEESCWAVSSSKQLPSICIMACKGLWQAVRRVTADGFILSRAEEMSRVSVFCNQKIGRDLKASKTV